MQPLTWYRRRVMMTRASGFHRVADFSEPGLRNAAPIPATIIPDAMENVGGALFRCSVSGFTLMPPPAGTGGELMLLSIVFRPTVRRDAAAAVRAAA